MSAKNYYDILGISPDTTQDQIRHAYRLRMRVLHPDRFDRKTQPAEWEHANQMLKELNEAYWVLKDPTRRAQYDKQVGNRIDSEYSPERATRVGQNNNNQSTTLEFGRLSAGSCSVDHLPENVRNKLKRRQNKEILDQYKVSTAGLAGNFFWLIASGGWFAILLYLIAEDYRWSRDSLYIYGGITLIASILIGANLQKLRKWFGSDLRPNVYVTPLYFIETTFDKIWYWPLWTLEDMNITHNYRNNSYQDTRVILGFSDLEVAFTVTGKEELDLFKQYVKDFNHRIQRAKIQKNWQYFIDEDDFRELEPLEGQESGFAFGTVATYALSLTAGTVLFFAAYQTNLRQPSRTGIPNQSTSTSAAQSEAFDQSERPLPRNGAEKIYYAREAVAPLEIETQGGEHHFVKLESLEGDLIATIFVHSGESITTEVPPDSYKIKYATGETWYGEEYLFGPQTSYHEVNRVLTFERNRGYTLELFLQTDGNLDVDQISPADW